MSYNEERSVLLSRFSASTSTLNSWRDIVTDSSEVLPAFCQSLEAILQQGLKRGLGVLGLADRDYWNCIEGLTRSSKVISRVPPSVSHVISTVKHCNKVQSSLSRGRLFIRTALTKGVLAQTLQTLVDNQEYARYWYKDSSVLVDYKEKGVVVDILKSLKKKTYKLDVNNYMFLDESWLMPNCHQFEFVPTRSLGLKLFTIERKCMVIDVEFGSAAAEKGITTGDCLSELFGQLIDEKWSTRIADLKKKYKGRPITATFVKGRFPDGRWFSPLFQRYRMLCEAGKCSADLPVLEDHENKPPNQQYNETNVRHAYNVVYLGCSDVGDNGRCIFVQDGIEKLLKSKNVKTVKMRLQLMERDIMLVETEKNETIARYSYTETSSCALYESNRTQFGFITGNTTCSFADQFLCHVFTCESVMMAKEIIEGIGKGFDRTVYCV